MIKDSADSQPSGFGADIKALPRLAAPVIGSRLGMLTMSLADTVMLGRFAARELAYQSIAITMPLFVTTIGLCLGTLVETARAAGAGNPAGCGAAWRRGLVYAAGLGLICLGLALAGETVLHLSGQSAELSLHGGRVVRILALGLPFMIVYVTCSYFFEALKRPAMPMIMMGAANLLNIFLNWMWIYGNLGSWPMGATGSAWATTAVRAALAAAIILYIWNLRAQVAGAAPLIAFIAFILIPDEVVLSHALRGRGDTVLPVLTHFISYLFVMIPLSWLLALKLERGAEGILEAILIASVVAAALLIWRFYYLAKRGRVA